MKVQILPLALLSQAVINMKFKVVDSFNKFGMYINIDTIEELEALHNKIKKHFNLLDDIMIINFNDKEIEIYDYYIE